MTSVTDITTSFEKLVSGFRAATEAVVAFDKARQRKPVSETLSGSHVHVWCKEHAITTFRRAKARPSHKLFADGEGNRFPLSAIPLGRKVTIHSPTSQYTTAV